MRLIAAAIALALAAFFMTASPALALHCHPREAWAEFLAEKYGERPVEFGVTISGGLMERFATPDGKTWTFLITDPNGTSCAVAAGAGWEKAIPKLLKPMGLRRNAGSWSSSPRPGVRSTVLSC